jgi:hypothetical protein
LRRQRRLAEEIPVNQVLTKAATAHPTTLPEPV